VTIIAGPLPTPTAPDQKLTPTVDRRARYSHLSVGLLAAGDGAVTAAPSPDMTVRVAAISGALIDDGVSFGAGKYWFESDAQATVTLDAADGSLPRIDLIVAKVQDTDAGDGSLTPQLTKVTGTPNASPTAPATPARCLALAQISVPAADTTISSGQITDVRTFAGTVARCGVRLHKTASSVATASITAISWSDELEDTDGFWSSGTTVTVPAGKDGVYAITFVTEGAFTGSHSFVDVNIASTTLASFPGSFRQMIDAQDDKGLISIVTPLAAGDSFTLRVYHETGSTVTFESYLSVYRVSP
jgi:hypothetical protein